EPSPPSAVVVLPRRHLGPRDRVSSRPAPSGVVGASEAAERMAPKIYHLHPLVAGPVRAWPGEFARIRAMGFNTVCLAPPFLAGERGDIFITRDHDRLHPALEWDGSAASAMEAAAAAAARAELRLMLDIAVDPIASGAGLRREHPGWYSIGGSGGTPDPRRAPRRLDAGYGRFDHTDAAEGIAE